MAIPSGLALQLGFGLESVAGRGVTPTTFVPILGETLDDNRSRLESMGIIAGRRTRTSDQWGVGNIVIGGGVQLELNRRSLGKIFLAMFGAVNTTGSGPYTHAFTPGDLQNDALTIQKGVPASNGTVYPLNFTGMKVASFELACAAGEIATLGTDWVGMRSFGYKQVTDGATTNGSPNITSVTGAFGEGDIGMPVSGTGIPANTRIINVTSTTAATLSANATATATGVTLTFGIALASPTYATGVDPMTFHNAALTLGGSSANVKAFTLSGDNGLDADRRFFGGDGTTAEPLEAAHRAYTGTMEVEFADLTQYKRYLDGTEVALACDFTAGTDAVQIDANVRLDGETPKVSGTGIVTATTNFTCLASSTDASTLTITLINDDETP